MDKRVDWVDYAKAIGILLVVYGHMARGVYHAGIDTPDGVYQILDSIVYSFHMPLFFFLSGLFFYSSFMKSGGHRLMLNKIDTLFYPYVIWSIFQGSLEVILSNYTNGELSMREVLALMWDPRAQFWFLYALFFVFAIMVFVYSWVPSKFGGLIFFISVLIYIYPNNLPDFKIVNMLVSNLVYFVFGVVFIQYAVVDRLASMTALTGLIVAFIMSQWIFHGYFGLLYTDKGLATLLLGLIAIVGVVSLAANLAKRNLQFIAYIGASSMAIYLMHILAGSGTRVLLNKLGVHTFAWHILIGCIIATGAPLLALIVIKKCKIPYLFQAPLSAWLYRLFQKTRPG